MVLNPKDGSPVQQEIIIRTLEPLVNTGLQGVLFYPALNEAEFL